MRKILVISNKNDEEFLRRRAANFDFSKFTKKEIQALIREMRKIMGESDGIGLAANQIGLDLRMFIARVDNKFYAIFNPEIIKNSKTTIIVEEGCLSLPEVFGLVERPNQISLQGFDRNGKKIKIKAWGTLARVFQHEVDHLNSVLFIDHLKKK